MQNAPSSHYVPALGYRWLTALYDPLVRYSTRERRFKAALLAQANLRAGQRLLDLACGTGTLAIMAKQRYPDLQMTGLDGDPAILQRARTKAAKQQVSIRFEHGFATTLPFAEASFDRVLSSLFFHPLLPEAKQQTFAEFHRVLRPGGELHIADWGKPTNPLMRALFYSIQLLDGFPNTRDNIEGRLPKMLRAAGFQAVSECRTFSTVCGTLSLYQAKKT
ncbi:MAG: class I SAM-dependent methyltransferase [Pseudomonadota bacterium]